MGAGDPPEPAAGARPGGAAASEREAPAPDFPRGAGGRVSCSALPPRRAGFPCGIKPRAPTRAPHMISLRFPGIRNKGQEQRMWELNSRILEGTGETGVPCTPMPSAHREWGPRKGASGSAPTRVRREVTADFGGSTREPWSLRNPPLASGPFRPNLTLPLPQTEGPRPPSPAVGHSGPRPPWPHAPPPDCVGDSGDDGLARGPSLTVLWRDAEDYGESGKVTTAPQGRTTAGGSTVGELPTSRPSPPQDAAAPRW